MTAVIAGGWIAFSVIAFCVAVFSVFFVRYYQDKHDSEAFPTIVTIIGLTVVLATACLVPVDIFLLSSTVNTTTGEREEWATQETIDSLLHTLEILYYVFYSVMMLFCFVIIPFAYFYFEEADEGVSTKQRAIGALKYTIFTVIIMIVIWLTGLFLKPGEADPTDPEWYKGLLNAADAVRAVSFTIAVMTLVGLFIFVSYTAYGLSALPVGMIRGRIDSHKEETDVLNDLEVTREKQRAIQAKYLSGRKMSKSDKKALDDLERKERLLSRRSNALGTSKTSWVSKCVACLRPFEVVFGVIFCLVTLLIILSVLLSSIDRAANSFCGASCGFIIDNPKIFNPIDSMLVYLSIVFPLDYIIMVGIIAYFFFCTMAGIVKIGIRFLWVYLYRIRARATVPQGLLFMCALLMLSLLCLNVFLITLSPGYTSFGYQKYCNTTIVDPENPPCVADPTLLLPCEVNAPEGKCTPTAISTIVNRIMVQQPFFGVVFHVGIWLFIGTFLIGLAVSICKKRPSAIELRDDSDDEV